MLLPLYVSPGLTDQRHYSKRRAIMKDVMSGCNDLDIAPAAPRDDDVLRCRHPDFTRVDAHLITRHNRTM